LRRPGWGGVWAHLLFTSPPLIAVLQADHILVFSFCIGPRAAYFTRLIVLLLFPERIGDGSCNPSGRADRGGLVIMLVYCLLRVSSKGVELFSLPKWPTDPLILSRVPFRYQSEPATKYIGFLLPHVRSPPPPPHPPPPPPPLFSSIVARESILLLGSMRCVILRSPLTLPPDISYGWILARWLAWSS